PRMRPAVTPRAAPTALLALALFGAAAAMLPVLGSPVAAASEDGATPMEKPRLVMLQADWAAAAASLADVKGLLPSALPARDRDERSRALRATGSAARHPEAGARPTALLSQLNAAMAQRIAG